MLKQRSGLSYEALAKRAHMSTSTLHRYCKGEGVPADYASVSRFARVCKATPEEMVELHRRWVMADAARERSRRAAADGAGSGAAAVPGAGSGAGSGAEAGVGQGAGPGAATAAVTGPGTGREAGPEAGVVSGAGAAAEPGPVSEPEPGRESVSEPGPEPEPKPESVSEPGPGPEPEPKPESVSEPEPKPGRESVSEPEPKPESVSEPKPERGPVSEVVAGAGSEELGGPGAEEPPDVGGATRRRGRRRRAFFRKRRVVVAASTLAVVALTTAVLENIDAGADPGGRPRAATLSTGSWEPYGSASPSTSPSPRPSGSAASKSPSAKPSASAGASAGTSGGGGAAATRDNAQAGPERDDVPLTVSARAHDWEGYCGTHYLVDRPPAQVPLPPATLQDAPKWASDADAVPAGRHRVSLAVQGTGDQAVLIESLDVRVVGSGAPLDWNAYEMGIGCGGGVEPREFGLDLDAARPAVRPKGGQRGFPYSVSRSDAEVLYITARTSTRDVKWYLVLEWSSGGRQGTIEIMDGGKPFHTTSMTGRPLYGYLPGSTEWEKQEPEG
ncbi:helix-turn-helix domain-containing protein [Streptomyces sp. NPDC006355]|uniref:helix-turn-helix domain-containing protein n=1 Tax=Streptomyces sp. NPDC006355 TaxID=3156758 RepID=UPI0033A52238